MSDITISYKGSSIATMDASGTKTLLTEGKYCEDDIEVVYVKPSGGTLGTKSISSNGEYNASSDNLDGYSSVTVNVDKQPDWANIISGIRTGSTVTLPESIDMYLPKLSDMSQSFYYASSNDCKSIKVKSDVPITNMNNAFNVTKLPSDCVITIDGDLSQCSNYSGAFAPRTRGYNHAVTIVANLDFTSLTSNTTNTFNNNTDIQNLTFVPNTLGVNFGIPDAQNLTNASIVSVANGLKQVAKTFTFHTTVKNKLSNIMGTVTNNGTYDFFTEDAQGATTLLDFITVTKGWTLA